MTPDWVLMQVVQAACRTLAELARLSPKVCMQDDTHLLLARDTDVWQRPELQHTDVTATV